jgi:hypothetical protein
VPSSAWDTISMDFVEGLPRSQHADCILVIVDKFSKYGHFLPLSHPYTAHSVAHSFLFNVYKIHGLSSVIISDRDLVFTSQFWQQPFRLAGIELKPSSSYHPQTDGQTEQVNQCLETYLRYFANVCPTKWKEWLPVGEYWYNTSLHSALGRAPFEVLYGRQPRTFGLSVNHTMPSQLADWLQERSVMQELVHQHLLWAQARMKKQAYQHHSECSFAVGEWVYLKLQPYAQSSMMSRAHHKLSFKYFGPYQITSHVGAVVYHLQLPDHYLIHLVVHVSQLKLVAGFKGTASPTLPMSLPERRVPIRVLQTRGLSKSNRLVQQVLVEWSGLPLELATWEDQEALRQCFPFAPAWGQAGFEGPRSVTNQGDVAEPGTSYKQDGATLDGIQHTIKQNGAARHIRRPNRRVCGPEWL